MKVFMLGWEFPPFISGGLGTACYGLTKALSQLGTEVVFVLPRSVDRSLSTHVRMLTPGDVLNEKEPMQASGPFLKYPAFRNVRFRSIGTVLRPYTTPHQYQQSIQNIIQQKKLLYQKTGRVIDPEVLAVSAQQGLSVQLGQYSGDMFSEVYRYAAAAVMLALQEDFDIIHTHDWMTYPAGIAVAAVTGRPLVVHVHSTEFDRSGEHVNQGIYDIERRGMHAADKVVAVSHLTKNIIMSRYGVPGEKIEVVYNGVDRDVNNNHFKKPDISSNEKIVLFLGRITMQKGPEYFLMAAKKVIEEIENVRFVMAGSGDMMTQIIEMAANMGIGDKVLFTGFLQGRDVEKVYQMADLYVMPSVSEPFGIAPLEALNHDVPVLISKQSGVSEVLTHVLKVDFWDIREMANKIIAVLKYPPLQMTLREHGNFEVRKLQWSDTAQRCLRIYNDAMVAL